MDKNKSKNLSDKKTNQPQKQNSAASKNRPQKSK
jgi:hypothetical protein